ncbi:hypothetical protein AC249_AIPGENE1310 [Exaiptasia diaphana]|nr:hypothetical protein AC249_AIPGENE1310 [Exaiptasia diaphana]
MKGVLVVVAVATLILFGMFIQDSQAFVNGPLLPATGKRSIRRNNPSAYKHKKTEELDPQDVCELARIFGCNNK